MCVVEVTMFGRRVGTWCRKFSHTRHDGETDSTDESDEENQRQKDEDDIDV